MKTVIFLFACLFLLRFGGLSLAQQSVSFKIIVNTSSDVASLTKDQASNLFLKKVTKWKNGHKVLPVDQVVTATVREAFCKNVHGKSVSAIKSYWQQKIFSGSDIPPPELDSDSAVLAYVQANADAVGYVSTGAATAGKVKVVEVTQ